VNFFWPKEWQKVQALTSITDHCFLSRLSILLGFQPHTDYSFEKLVKLRYALTDNVMISRLPHSRTLVPLQCASVSRGMYDVFKLQRALAPGRNIEFRHVGIPSCLLDYFLIIITGSPSFVSKNSTAWGPRRRDILQHSVKCKKLELSWFTVIPPRPFFFHMAPFKGVVCKQYDLPILGIIF